MVVFLWEQVLLASHLAVWVQFIAQYSTVYITYIQYIT